MNKPLKRNPEEIARLIDMCAFHFGFPDLLKKGRKEELVYARNVAVFLACRYKLGSNDYLASKFNFKNHSSIIHAQRCIKKDARKKFSFSKVDVNNIDLAFRGKADLVPRYQTEIGHGALTRAIDIANYYFGIKGMKNNVRERAILSYVLLSKEIIAIPYILHSLRHSHKKYLLDEVRLTKASLGRNNQETAVDVAALKSMIINGFELFRKFSTTKNVNERKKHVFSVPIYLLDIHEEKRYFFKNINECSFLMDIPIKELTNCVENTERVLSKRFKLRTE
jgi:hypothetical protein